MNRFFVSGYNKSGTTFLQMLLDAHPNINCPSEQHFLTLFDGLAEISKVYFANMQLFDRNTAQQGVHFDVNQFAIHLLKSAFDYLFNWYRDGQASHVGLNDNSLITKTHITTVVVPDAKYVFIVRDPRDIAISLYRHRMRTEPQFAASNIPVARVAKGVAQLWNRHMQQLISFRKTHADQVDIVRYEDLISEQRELHLERILEFLAVPHDKRLIQGLFDATNFDTLKQKHGPANPFFRSGKKGQWKDGLDNATQQFVARTARFGLTHFGYDTETQHPVTPSSTPARQPLKMFVMHNIRGSLQHFFHFLYGGLIPLIDFYVQEPSHGHYVIGNDIGPLTTILDELPIPWCKQPGQPQIDQHIDLPGYDCFLDADLQNGVQRLTPQTRENVCRFFEQTMPMKIREDKTADILVIERGTHPFYKTNAAHVKTSGSERRSIANHQQLVQTLTDRYGSVLNVVLEHMSIYHQFWLFRNAKLIIGQHGAGLSNIFFSKQGTHMLEISPPYGRSLGMFKNMAHMLGVRYARLLQETEFAPIEIDALCNTLQEFYQPS